MSFCTEVIVLLMPSVLGVGVLFRKKSPLSPYIFRNSRPSSFRIGESIDFIDFNYARMIKSVFSHYYIRNTSLENNCFNCRRNTPPPICIELISCFINLNYACCTKTSGVYKICKRLILLRCFYCSEYAISCIIRVECCSHHIHPSTL